MKVRLFVLAAIALLLAACGGGSSSGSAEDFCEQAEVLGGDGIGEIDAVDESEAFAEGVQIFSDLTDAAPSEIADDMELFEEVLTTFASVDEDDPEAALAVIATLFDRADEIEAAGVNIETYLLDECGIEADAGTAELGLGGDDTDPFGGSATSYGDDPGLDALQDSCAAGDLDACDELYLTSPFGSDYEAFGSTCGETSTETFGGCALPQGGADDDAAAGDTDVVTDNPSDAMFYGDDPALDALWDSCAAGDLDACDTLYLTSPFGSDYEAFGSTCGETQGDTFGRCSAPVSAGGS
ncbi:MAG: hypothetical protein AAGA99_26820, partial [Actinomycetota bacterium]